MTLLLFYFCLAIGVSFLCSVLEAVLLSLSPAYISAATESGYRHGKLLAKLKHDIDRPLAAILTLNTAAHTIGAAGVGAQAQTVFNDLPTALISGILTMLILVFSEIIPKTIGATYWRQIAPTSAYIIEGMTIILCPFVWLSKQISRYITPKESSPSISREEIIAIANIGQQQGVIDASDAGMLQSVVRFQSLKIRDVFTPRTVVHIMRSGQTVQEVIDNCKDFTYSRFPVLEESEHIVGYVLRNDILTAAAKDQWKKTINELTRKVLIVQENVPLKRILSLFLRKREHIAVVIDEFGSFAGVLTLEDVMESLIGLEIMDEADDVEDLRLLAMESSINEPEDMFGGEEELPEKE